MKEVMRRGRLGLAPTMLGAMLLALGVSAASALAVNPDPPACDGGTCHHAGECGTKCICNLHDSKCYDNTAVE